MNRFYFIALIATVIGCADSSSVGLKSPADIASESPEQTAKNYFKWRYSVPEPGRPMMYDSDYWIKTHLTEILQTVEVAEVIYADNIALVLMRYSVGGKVFRESLELRKYKSLWTVFSYQYYSSYDDPYGDGDTAKAKRFREQVRDWEEASAKRF